MPAVSATADPVRDYNETLKAAESLAKREEELLHKLSQSEQIGSDQRKRWVDELAEVISAVERLEKKRLDLLKSLGN